MILFLRTFFALLLTALFAFGTTALAVHSQTPGGVAMVICGAEGQARTIFVDAQGNRAAPGHDCPDCTLAKTTLPDFDLPRLAPISATNARPDPNVVTWVSFIAAEQHARGPPVAA
jgi:hypothetical protein